MSKRKLPPRAQRELVDRITIGMGMTSPVITPPEEEALYVLNPSWRGPLGVRVHEATTFPEFVQIGGRREGVIRERLGISDEMLTPWWMRRFMAVTVSDLVLGWTHKGVSLSEITITTLGFDWPTAKTAFGQGPVDYIMRRTTKQGMLKRSMLSETIGVVLNIISNGTGIPCKHEQRQGVDPGEGAFFPSSGGQA